MPAPEHTLDDNSMVDIDQKLDLVSRSDSVLKRLSPLGKALAREGRVGEEKEFVGGSDAGWSRGLGAGRVYDLDCSSDSVLGSGGGGVGRIGRGGG